MKTRRSTACTKTSGSLCGSSSSDELAALQLATAPQVYDARSKFSVNVVGPVKDQGECGMCVAFAVLAAAQTAAAVGLRQSFSSATLSELDYYICRAADEIQRSCSTGWSLEKGMRAFRQLHKTDQLPVVEACRQYAPFSPSPCGPALCDTTLPQLRQGEYIIKQLGSIVEMQRHIRLHGSIVCSMQLYSDVKPFFAANRSAVYQGPGRGALQGEAHAVQVVGYDNSRQAWLIKNSWGPGFAAGGFAWVGFGAPGMCDQTNTYGFAFSPSQLQTSDMPRLTPVPDRKGCYTYEAVAGDYPEGLAYRLEIPLQQLLLDNLDVIQDPSVLPAGTTLLLCNVSSAVAAGGSPAGVAPTPSNSSASRDEVAALLAIKRVLDPPGTALRDWQPGSTSPCRWTGVLCGDDGKQVTTINFWDAATQATKVQLSGQLPNGTLLSRLPGLVYLGVSRANVSGSLPEDWSQLTKLEELYLSGNKLTGPLPPSWAALTKLREIRMWNNTLTGPLPGSWSGMAALEGVDLAFNNLTGTLPPTWSRLTALRDLRVSSNQFRGPLPPSWGALKKLKMVYLFSNTISGPVPNAWSGMAALEELSLAHTELTGTLPPTWSSMTALWDLRINDCKLSGPLPPSWGALSKLKLCWLHRNNLSGPLQGSWSGMAALEDLQMNRNRLTGPLPPSWGALTKLKVCWLFNNTLSGPLPGSWSGMAALEDLQMNINRLTGTLPPSWGALTKLKVCWVHDNNLSGSLPGSWSGMAALEELSLSDASLTGTLPPTWSRLAPALRDLRLINCRLNGTLPSSWGALTKLKVVYLFNNTLSGPLPAAWSGMAALEELSLGDNALTGTLPPTWSNLTALWDLRVTDCKLSGPLPPSWGALTKLKVCYLFNSSLSGPLPGSWSQMAALEELALGTNALAGTVPPSWGSWSGVKVIELFGNRQLSGCLPAAWRGKVNVDSVVAVEGPYEGGDPLTAGTNFTGFC